MVIHGTTVGFGKHTTIATIPAPSLDWFIITLLFNTTLAVVKISVLLFYARLFWTVKTFRIALWITAVLCLALPVAFNIHATFTCIPVQKFWRPQLPGHCLAHLPGYIVSGILNIVTDFMILLLPMPIIWNLHTSRNHRAYLIGTFAAGYRYIHSHSKYLSSPYRLTTNK